MPGKVFDVETVKEDTFEFLSTLKRIMARKLKGLS